MPVPSAITDLSQTPGLNSPAGSEAPSLLDNYDRAHAAFIAMLRDGQGFSTPVDMASAGTTDIGAQASLVVRITGTTTITSFGATYSGPRFLTFGGALTLTHNATSLILPGGVNLATAAGDCAIAIPNAAAPTGWRLLSYQRAGGAGFDVSSVVAFARNTAPAGWLKANGAAVSRTTYGELFAAIGTTFGAGDGSTTFNLPDLRGEFPRGWDDGRGVDAGRTFGSIQGSQNASHNHTGSTDSAGLHNHGVPNVVGPSAGNAFGTSTGSINTVTAGTTNDGTHVHSFTTGSSGGAEARPRNLALLYCIKF